MSVLSGVIQSKQLVHLQVIPLLFLGTGAVGFFISIQFASGISWLAEHVDLTGGWGHYHMSRYNKN